MTDIKVSGKVPTFACNAGEQELIMKGAAREYYTQNKDGSK